MKSIIRDLPIRVTIQNVVASASLGCSLDLKAVFKAFFPNVEYRPETFPGLAFKLKKPKSCTLLFKTGKMVCTGTKSEREAERAVMKVIRELRKAGVAAKHEKPEFAVQNIVASVNLGGVRIDLEGIALKSRGNVLYEPEQFPGLIYRMDDPKVVFLIFVTGKLVCVGAKSEKEVYRAVEKLIKILEEKDAIIKS